MTSWLIYGGIIVGLLLLTPTVLLVISAHLMPRATLKPMQPDDAEAERRMGEAALDQTWLSEQSFQWENAYHFHSFIGKVTVRAWRQPESATFLCQYVFQGGKTTTDIVSIFSLDKRVGLTTGSTRDAQFMPHRPGIFVQSFSGVDTATLWQRHTESEVVVADVTGVNPEPVNRSFDELLLDAIRDQMEYVRSLPLWPLRAPYWYYIKRFRVHNKPVRALIDNGHISADHANVLLRNQS